jgi:nitrate/nitrite transport system ATP-binding protein
MMTNGPAATIGEILDIKLQRPRNRVELADSAEYNHYRAAVLKFLYERQRNPQSAGGSGEPARVEGGRTGKPLQVVASNAAA